MNRIVRLVFGFARSRACDEAVAKWELVMAHFHAVSTREGYRWALIECSANCDLERKPVARALPQQRIKCFDRMRS
jgi:hypothetical protein